MKKTKPAGDWKLFDCYQFLSNIQLSLQFDAPLEFVLRFLFSSVLSKFMLWSKCTMGIHLFSNFIDASKFETHHLYIDNSEPYRKFRRETLELRNVGQNKIPDFEPPPFIYFAEEESFAVEGWKQKVDKLRMDKNIHHRPKESILDILESFNMERKRITQERLQNLEIDKQYYSEIQTPVNDVLIIPFNYTNFQLGVFVLWNNEMSNPIPEWEKMEEELLVISKTIQKTIADILSNHYYIIEKTYLPSYRKEGPNDVVVLFADIRGFTTVTEIARDRGFSYDLMRFMSNYFKSMTDAIEKFGGRVEKMAGDSIMGIFGEYDKDSKKAVKNAVSTAYKMYEQFQELKSKFLEEQKIKDFFNKYNEPLEFDLGIGINYGEVLFGYFGKPGSRQYMGLGDHANFAQRLEYSASRFDSNEKRKRAPILLSRTAYNLIKDLIENTANPNVLMLALRGKSYEYPVYEFTPELAKSIFRLAPF